jgi:SAM-dependent methyltransferase
LRVNSARNARSGHNPRRSGALGPVLRVDGVGKITMHKRVGVLVVAHNAAGTLAGTLDRIPADFRERIDEIIVMDDASGDETFAAGADWARRNHLVRTTVLRHTKTLGYGGNQKAGYRLAIEHGLDVVVLLHGDGRHPPEAMPDLVRPLLRDEADAAFGSRMLTGGGARAGGMPLHRYLGNRVLTQVQNRLLGARLSEWHSGYRAYSTAALRTVPFEANADGFDFDTQIIVQLVHGGRRIVELPVPTCYGDGICRVNGFGYARDVLRDLLEYRRVSVGFGTSDWVPEPSGHRFKEGMGGAHGALLAELAQLPPGRILDLGCAGGLFAEQARELGHRVVGVDRTELDGVRDRMNLFVHADLDDGLPESARVAAGYDVVVAADVLQHLARPEQLLREIRGALRPGGQVLVCVPNAVHWYPRLRFALGRFGYDRRGILDEDHLRFFTRGSLRRTLARTGYDLLDEQSGGLPPRVLGGGTRLGRLPAHRLLTALDRALARRLPNLFAYQLLARLTPHHEDTVSAPGLADEVFGPRFGTVPGQLRGARTRTMET